MAGGRVLQLIRQASRERGAVSAELADQALDQLVERQEIISYWPTTYEEDKFGGKDRIVMRCDGIEVPLQIKSSRSGFISAMKSHPEVPCVVVEAGDPVVTIMENILHVLERK